MKPWSLEHFKAFLMLYIARIDLDVSQKEMNAITEKLNYESLQWARSEMEKLNDYQCLDLIQKQSSILITSKERHDELVNEMQEIARVDGERAIEDVTIHAIERIMPRGDKS